MSPTKLEVADPSQYLVKEDRYPASSWKLLSFVPPLSIKGEDETLQPSVTFTGSSPNVEAAGTIDRLSVKADSEVTLEIGDNQSTNLTLKVHRDSSSCLLSFREPFTLITDYIMIGGIKELPYEVDSLTYKIQLTKTDPHVEITSQPRSLITPYSRNRGLPIGNLTSQFFANAYLNGFDHYVKENLKCKFYIRYMDDMVVFDNSKIRLREVRQAIIEALGKLRLKVHLNKAQIQPVEKGIDWLGYRVYPTHRRVRRSNVKRFRRRLKHLAEAYSEGRIEMGQIKPSIMSWLGHVKHADSYHMRKNVLGEVSFHRG